MKPASTLVLILSSVALGCQAGEGEMVSHTSQKSQVVIVPEVSRTAVMTDGGFTDGGPGPWPGDGGPGPWPGDGGPGQDAGGPGDSSTPT